MSRWRRTARKIPRHHRCQLARALAGPARQQEQRIALDDPPQRRQHRDVYGDAAARLLVAILEDLANAAANLFGEAVDMTRFERERRNRDAVARNRHGGQQQQDRQTHTLTVRRAAGTLQRMRIIGSSATT